MVPVKFFSEETLKGKIYGQVRPPSRNPQHSYLSGVAVRFLLVSRVLQFTIFCIMPRTR